jgi:predicted Zn-dependent protease
MMLTVALIELWHRANRSDKAWEVLDAFAPPTEYGYLPLVLRAALYAFDKELTKAEKALAEAQANYPEHPVVLAYACEYWEQAGNWEKVETAGRKLVDIIQIPQSFRFYLNALLKRQKG